MNLPAHVATTALSACTYVQELCTADGVAVERMVANAANDTAAANTTAEAAAPSSALAAGTSVAVASAALLAVVQGL